MMEEVVKKLKLKGVGTVINAPKDLVSGFDKLGFKTVLNSNSKTADTLVFINDNAEFLTFLKNDLKNIEHDGVLWFAYPKGTSKIKTDINRDTVRETGISYGIKTVTAISIDDTWSALRFRPIDMVGK